MDLRPSRGCAAVFCGLVGGLIGLVGSGALNPDAAWATHEADHRFTISGHVRDKDGQPVRDVKVQARDLRDQAVEPVTSYADESGWYTLMLHLHNSNLGDPIQISATDERAGVNEVKKIRAEFDPNDKHAERQATVEFGPASEKAPTFWWYGAGGVLAAVAVGVAMAHVRHRRAALSATSRGKKRL